MVLSDLYLYPIKSLGGIRVERAELTDRGLRHDRRRGGGDQDGKDGEKLHDGPVLHRCD